MRYTAYNEPQLISIPFQAPDRGPCTVTVTVYPDNDPVRHGQHLLGLDYAPAESKGFPCTQMTVSSPISRGYAAMYGWIQLVAPDGMVSETVLPENLSEASWGMDPIPITTDLETPFTWFGIEPTLFDKPSRAPKGSIDWVARSFLCYLDSALGGASYVSPSSSHKRPKPLLVVEWGFWMEDGKPYVKEVKQIDLTAWNDHVKLFRAQFPSWKFDDVES